MSTYIDPGRFYTTDTGENITFDTNDPRLIITNQVIGSVVRPTPPATSYRARAVNFAHTEVQDFVDVVAIGSCAPAATDVFGMQRSLWSAEPSTDSWSQAPVTNDGEWINVSGSLVEYLCAGHDDGQAITAGIGELSRPVNFKGLLMVDYYCSGGVVYMRETCKLIAYCAQASGFTFTTTIPSRTVEFNLLTGYYGA
jgi:hypothetical protein